MLENLLDRIIQIVASSAKPLKTRELSRKMGIPPLEYQQFRRLVREAVANGRLGKAKGGKLILPIKEDILTGKLFVSKAGHGFVVPLDGTPDLFVAPHELGGAIHGEEVEVVLKSGRRGKSREGKIIRVNGREKGRVVGRVVVGRSGMTLIPTDPRIRDKIELHNPGKLAVENEMIVTARLAPWEAPYLPPKGSVEEVLGMAGSPGIDMESLIISHGLPREFDDRVKPELAAIKKAVKQSDITGRLDLRSISTFTIDPADAKDHDDAISVEELPDDRVRLGVHIADVSYYVLPDMALDSEARLRGNSVYLVDRVIPMLPEKLSADICSLHENEDRLTLSFIAELDMKGRVYQWKFVESIIRSSASLSYEEVQEFIDSKQTETDKIDSHMGESLRIMLELSRSIRAERFNKGGLDFDLPESKIILDAFGKVLDIFTPPRIESQRIVEEFMLLANKHAAVYLQGAGAPILFRVHDKPDTEKIRNFAELLKEMGYSFNFKGEITSKKLQRVLKAVEGKPEEKFIEEILLRSLAKAAYQPENIGHFGLAFTNYTHFTSPIRRYPDLLVHRVMRLLLNKKLTYVIISEMKASLKRIGEHCTETEIAADSAERESLKIKELEYLQERVGGDFDGIISGVVKTGFFVELIGSMVEGFVPFSSIEDDYFVLDEGKHRAIGKNSRRVFKLGDKARVVVVKVDLENRRADFILIDEKKKPGIKKKRGSRRRPI